MKDPKQAWVWIGVVVVVLVVIAWAWALIMPRKAQPAPATTAAPAPVFAPKGELAPQFPKDLILDSDASIAGSYTLSYSSTTAQYTAQYNSASSASSLFSAYKAFFSKNGWTIAGSSSNAAVDMVAGKQGNAKATVFIVVHGKGAQVSITYIPQ